jgi:Flp pilus assembly protein TadB
MTALAPWVLGLAWGLVVATPLARRARRVPPRARTGALASVGRAERGEATPKRLGRRLVRAVPGPVRAVIGRVAEQRRTRVLEHAVARELPVTVDLLGVAVGAGCTPFLAVDTAARWAPPTLAAWLDEVRRSCALGRGFGDALDDRARRVPSLQPLADALLASDRFGAPVGDALVRLAAEQRTALRRRAEARARTVPVRLLFPLIFLVLPAFGLLTVVPAVLAGIGGT